jgi:uncharacterized cupin superfamily protein
MAMSKLDVGAIPALHGSDCPAPFGQAVSARLRQRLGDAGGLTAFGVNRLCLPPGCWSAQRHWHSAEDEFVYIIEGELVLVSDEGEQTMRAGDCAAFAANAPNGHHLVNRSGAMAVCLEVGSRSDVDRVVYPDIDLVFDAGTGCYGHKDGAPY